MLQDELERYIDQKGLINILDMIGDICREKAAHLRESWQDPKQAKGWDSVANKLDALAAKLPNSEMVYVGQNESRRLRRANVAA